MEISQEILKELDEVAPAVKNMGRLGTPYAVPAGFFEDFSKILMNRITFGESFSVEQDSLLETAEISPLLAGLQKLNPYQVPEGYFQNIIPQISAFKNRGSESVNTDTGDPVSDSGVLPANVQRAKTGHIYAFSRIAKYAAAACLVALLGITIFKVTNRNLPDPLHSLTTVSDQDMANYLDVDDIHWTPVPAPETASVEYSDNDIHSLFSNISDVELEQYHPDLPFEQGKAN